MNEAKRSCFFIMPFLPELHYFYLYVKQHIENRYNIHCARADEKVLTTPLLNKIREFIREADVIIADCSGRNPNVFYELGIAHAYNKDVILITKDPIEQAPSDIKHYEFIHYQLDNHKGFLGKLDNALYNIFSRRYEWLYEHAKRVFNEFKYVTKAQADMASKETFLSCVMGAERKSELPSKDDILSIEELVLPCIIDDTSSVTIMEQITRWLSEKRRLVV